MDVGEWLKGIGLGQYEATFRAHDLDVDVLPDVVEADLEKIGLPLGARKRLMKAIANLSPAESQLAREPPARAQEPPRPPAPTPSPRTIRPDAERRPITVMFCDLVGSTSLAANLDAEDWRNLVGAYLDEASGAVTRLGGHVLKRLGDGLMALFGYPQAQENDAERAARAALLIQRALADFNARNAGKAPALVARIGLDSGPVVVDATGEVFGEAPNIAARVQGLAEPGTVLVTANVQRQTAGLFVAEDRGAHELKGLAAPVTLYRIVRASGGRRTGARTLTPLVGREEELDLLRRRWERARDGAGQLTLIVGEPGIGKSRLVEEFRATLAETPHTFVELSSSQLLQNTPLHPIADWGRQRFGSAETPAARRLADLDNTLRLIGLDPAEYAPLIAPLVDIPLPEERAAKFAPEELRRRQLAALTTWFLAGARSQPVALAFEDLHWADPTSLDLMQALAERGAHAPMLILATARPEFRPPWSFRPHHSVIALAPLDRTQVARMVGKIASSHSLSNDVIEGVSERTGGVPLFVEEVTRLLLERGGEGGAQAIPPTLQQSLAARLDRLGEAREVAQIGAVLGRDFSYTLLRAVARAASDDGDSPPPPPPGSSRWARAVPRHSVGEEDRPISRREADALSGGGGGVAALSERGDSDPALQSALERLAEADLLFVEGAPPNASYRFKHALIRDAAYESLLKSRRQALHRRAAEALLNANAEPEAIAHHFTEAGLDDAAIKWWGRAGDRALRRSAFQEAIAHLGKAIAIADKAAGAAPRRADAAASLSRRLKLQTEYGQAVMWSKGFAAEETKSAFARAAELAARTDDFSERFSAGHGQWTLEMVRGELRSARELASSFLREAEDLGRVVETGVARRGLALICYFLGDFDEARTHCERALEACAPGHEEKARERFGEYTGPLVMSCLALATWQLGEVDRARELIEMANRRAAELGHIPSMAIPLVMKSMFEIMRGDAAAELMAAEALKALAQQHGMTLQRTWAEMLTGWARGHLQDPADGADELRRGLKAYADSGARHQSAYYSGLLAELEAETPNIEGALARLDEALRLAEQVETAGDLPFLHRLRGEILLKHAPANRGLAEKAFQTALGISQRLGARSWGLRAALSLAKLYQSTGRRAEAHAVLAPALEGFSPTPEMLEIGEAQALLAAFAETDEVKGALEKRQARAKMHLDYARAMQWAKGWGAEEARTAIERAHEFAPPTPGHPDYWSLTYGRFAVSLLRGEFRAALEIAENYLRQAEAERRPDHAVNARRLLGTVKLELGAFFESRQEFEKLLEDWDEDRDKGLRAMMGADVLCVGWAYMAQLLMNLGKVEDAVRMSEGAIRRAESFGDFGSLAFALGLSLFVLAMCGRTEATLRRAETFEAAASEKGARLWESIAREWASWARGLTTGDAAGATTELRDIMAARREGQDRQSACMGQGLLAQLQGKASAIDDALASIAQGFALAEQTGGHRADSFLHRVRGDILAESDPAAAEASYREALGIAESQGARTFELQAAHALAKLLSAARRPVEAHSILARALEGFAPTPDMREIAEAQALLEQLSCGDNARVMREPDGQKAGESTRSASYPRPK